MTHVSPSDFYIGTSEVATRQQPQPHHAGLFPGLARRCGPRYVPNGRTQISISRSQSSPILHTMKDSQFWSGLPNRAALQPMPMQIHMETFCCFCSEFPKETCQAELYSRLACLILRLTSTEACYTFNPFRSDHTGLCVLLLQESPPCYAQNAKKKGYDRHASPWTVRSKTLAASSNRTQDAETTTQVGRLAYESPDWRPL